MNILKLIAKELSLTFRNEYSLDLQGTTINIVHSILISNGFSVSKVRKNKYQKGKIELVLDPIGGFLYVPPL